MTRYVIPLREFNLRPLAWDNARTLLLLQLTFGFPRRVQFLFALVRSSGGVL